MTGIQKKLFEMQDLEYKRFHAGLMPTIEPETVIGVRIPQLRKLAKETAKDPETKEFLAALPHTYYEENNLHGFLIEGMKDYEECVGALDSFLPYVDNWATCDSISPRVFRKHPPRLPAKIQEWMDSGKVYTVRFGIGMLMKFYLDEEFRPDYLEMVSSVSPGEYYVDMMAAWYFATALAKQYEAALPYIAQRKLAPWTHNKTIQKAMESRRITQEQKQLLKQLR